MSVKMNLVGLGHVGLRHVRGLPATRLCSFAELSMLSRHARAMHSSRSTRWRSGGMSGGAYSSHGQASGGRPNGEHGEGGRHHHRGDHHGDGNKVLFHQQQHWSTHVVSTSSEVETDMEDERNCDDVLFTPKGSDHDERGIGLGHVGLGLGPLGLLPQQTGGPLDNHGMIDRPTGEAEHMSNVCSKTLKRGTAQLKSPWKKLCLAGMAGQPKLLTQKQKRLFRGGMKLSDMAEIRSSDVSLCQSRQVMQVGEAAFNSSSSTESETEEQQLKGIGSDNSGQINNYRTSMKKNVCDDTPASDESAADVQCPGAHSMEVPTSSEAVGNVPDVRSVIQFPTDHSENGSSSFDNPATNMSAECAADVSLCSPTASPKGSKCAEGLATDEECGGYFDQENQILDTSSSVTTDTTDTKTGDDDCDDDDTPTTSFDQRQRLIMIQTYANRHNLDGAALSDLLLVLSCLSPNVAQGLPTTATGIRKRLLLDEIHIQYKYSCAKCNNGQLMEKSCGHAQVSTYVYISLDDQLRLKFKDKNFLEDLKWRFNRNKLYAENIEDVYDCKLYRHYIDTGFLQEAYNLSWKLSIDGVPISHSSNVSAWPVLLKPNEVPPSKRRIHSLLVGLFVGSGKPNLDHLLTNFFLAMNRLCTDGLNIHLPGGLLVNTKSMIFSVHADLPAKAQLLNMNQFNGDSCCLNCFCRGENHRTGHGGNVRVMPYSRDHPAILRTHGDMVHDGELASKQTKPVRGIKGKSILSVIDNFDLVRCTAIDYMHQSLLGITRGLMRHWFDSANHAENWYCGKKASKDTIDRNLLNIKPPAYIARSPRSVSQLSYWKASEFRNFLLFYMVPCLTGVLPSFYLQHVSLLASGVYLCTKNSISSEDLAISAECFRKFVALTPTLYSARFMSLNVHSLLHVTNMVKELGSLHDNSNFDFEDMMGDVKKSVHGTRYMPSQIVNNVLMKQFSSQLGDQLDEKHRAVFDKMMSTKHGISSASEHWQVVGKGQKASGKTKTILRNNGIHVTNTCTEILRAKKKKSIFTSRLYKRQNTRINYAVEYTLNGAKIFGLVYSYVKADKSSEMLAVIEKLQQVDEKLINGLIIEGNYHNTTVRTSEFYDIVPLDCINEKVIYIEMGESCEKAIVCKSPNNTEFLA